MDIDFNFNELPSRTKETCSTCKYNKLGYCIITQKKIIKKIKCEEWREKQWGKTI